MVTNRAQDRLYKITFVTFHKSSNLAEVTIRARNRRSALFAASEILFKQRPEFNHKNCYAQKLVVLEEKTAP